MGEVAIVAQAFRDTLRPEPVLTVAEWADRYRVLSAKASAEPGPWRTARVPYAREPMECLSPSSPVEIVVLIWGAQLGKTETGNNWIGFVMDYAPGPMLAVQPTVDMGKRWSRQRLEPLIDETPRLAGKVAEKRSRDSSNTVFAKDFPGGMIIITGANSASGLRSMPVRYLFSDEVDAYPGDVDGEGDPFNLARARTRTFSRRKVLATSTPTLAGISRIESLFHDSDQRRFFVPCPACGELDFLRWARIKWPKHRPQEAACLCESCGVLIEEHHKTRMLEAGEWRAERPGAAAGKIAGFHLPALYSPVGWYSWGQAAEDWERAQGHPDQLRVFVNTVLAETWRERGDAPEWKRLYERRSTYRVGTVPEGGLLLTAGVDVQKDRIEAEIVAWGREKRSWSVDYLVLRGDPFQGAVWDELAQVFDRTFPHALGGELRLRLMGLDSGYATQEVYSFARRHGMGRVLALKGSDTATMILGQPATVDIRRDGRRIFRGAKVWPVGTHAAKVELYGWLRSESPGEGEPEPAGYCRWPEYGEEYFRQLTAEQLVTKPDRRGYVRQEWRKVRERNEALDCRLYARAASVAVGIDRFEEKHWRALEEELGARPAEPRATKEAAPEGAAPREPKEKPARRRRRPGSWIGGR